MYIDAEDAPVQTPANESLEDELPREPAELDQGLALALSGHGNRAVLFQLGVLWYLNDAGYLYRLDRIASVSGASITAGVLASRWLELRFDALGRAANFAELVAAPLRRFAQQTIDTVAVITSFFGSAAGDRLGKALQRVLFGEKTLQDLPDEPHFTFGATSMQTGALFRFTKAYMAEWHIGRAMSPRVPLATAVAASASIPTLLPPVHLKVPAGTFQESSPGYHVAPYTTDIVLTDGGIYDTLGIETVWKRYQRILVSDGSGRFVADPKPPEDLVRQGMRVRAITDNQVRSVRKRQIIGAFFQPTDPHTGAYWAMWSRPSDYPIASLPVSDEKAGDMASIPTRYAALPAVTQNRLINFGYAMAERAIQSYYDRSAFRPVNFPCPGGV